MAPDEDRDGIVQAIHDYDGRWPIPIEDSVEDDYSEESFA